MSTLMYFLSSLKHHGFCKSTQLGNGDLTVNCEIYDVQVCTVLFIYLNFYIRFKVFSY